VIFRLEKNITVCLVLAVISFSLYFHTLFFGITNADDEVLIASNLAFLGDSANIFRAFVTDAFYLEKSIDLYRPLQSVSFILDAQWGSDVVFNAHLTNLLLHIAFCIAFYHLLLLLEFRRQSAFAGAMIYSVHYLFLSAVAWLPARGDLLLALFSLLAVITFIRLLEDSRRIFLLLHLLCFALATFSKETAVLLPFLFLTYLWAYAKKGFLQRRHLLLPLCYLAVEAVYFALKGRAVAARAGEVGLVPLWKNIRTLPEMVAKFFVPVNIVTMPSYTTLATISGLLLIALLAAAHVHFRKRLDRRQFFYLAWLLIFVVPAMSYFPNFYNYFYEHIDHRAYLASAGLLMLLLSLVETSGLQDKKHFQAFTLLLLLCLAALNIHFSKSYRNPEEFALSTIRANPNSALAFLNYGVELLKKGDDDEALRNFSAAIRICSIYMPALHQRAIIYIKRGRNDEALADLNALLKAEPTYSAEDYYLRGWIRSVMKEYSAAKPDFEAALRLDRDFKPAEKALFELEKSASNIENLRN